MKDRDFVSFGIDFGTTNTVVSKSRSRDDIEILRLDVSATDGRVHPSVLAFESMHENNRHDFDIETGTAAIALASDWPDDVRYVQSFKSHVASRDLDGTVIFGKRFDFPDLLACFLRKSGIADRINEHAGEKKIIVGRPVKFHGERPDDALAVSRYQAAFATAGIADFDLALEPVGGAFSFFKSLKISACVLIADFGGGTSDFVIARFSPTRSGVRSELLSHAGVGIAGDSFDHQIIHNALLHHFGSNASYRLNGKALPVPRSYFSALSQWHQLTRLRAPKFLDTLKDIRRTVDDPQAIDTLIHTITHNKGLAISKSVSAAKAALSEKETAEIVIELGDVTLREQITRTDFETWIADDVRQIERTLDDVILRSGIPEGMIDQVFLTGGTSFVPRIFSLFADRFGADRVLAGDRFSSVAEGLSLIGLEADTGYWTRF